MIEQRLSNGMRPPVSLAEALSPRQRSAVFELVARVLEDVRARLVQASLFGSRARGTPRPDSDIDVLLVFADLPPDREPHATHAEAIAEELADLTGIPLTAWSVSLIDLEHGRRTPMLVDAMREAIPVWFETSELGPVPFTPRDALYCTNALLRRVHEGSEIFALHRSNGCKGEAARRLRDDLVRLCTASLLLRGETRPRRSEVIQRFCELESSPLSTRSERSYPGAATPEEQWVDSGDEIKSEDSDAVLRWVARSFGPDGRDDERPVRPPPCSWEAAAALVDTLEQMVATSARALDRISRN